MSNKKKSSCGSTTDLLWVFKYTPVCQMLNFIHLGTDHWCCLSEKSAWQNLRNTVKKQPKEQVGGWSFVLLGATWQPNNAYSPQFVKEYTLSWEPLIKLDLPHMKEKWRREQWTIHYSTQDPHSWNRFVFTSNLLSHFLRKYKWVMLGQFWEI